MFSTTDHGIRRSLPRTTSLTPIPRSLIGDRSALTVDGDDQLALISHPLATTTRMPKIASTVLESFFENNLTNAIFELFDMLFKSETILG